MLESACKQVGKIRYVYKAANIVDQTEGQWPTLIYPLHQLEEVGSNARPVHHWRAYNDSRHCRLARCLLDVLLAEPLRRGVGAFWLRLIGWRECAPRRLRSPSRCWTEN